jgi:NhaP-type Na+/H+ or K+/H+ antiporter
LAQLVLLCYSLVALILVAIWAERRHVPSSLAAVLVGALLGFVLRLAGAESAPALHSLLFFDEELFLYLLLPPIIFEAGFSVSRKFFFSNLATILLFAVVGTLLTTFVVGQACQIAGRAGLFRVGEWDALDFRVSRDAYTFGALISATDPVATLSIMGAYQVDPLMYTLVAGESVLNDAVAIVLVRILQSLGPAAFRQPSAYLLGIFQFAWVSLGSITVGITIAMCSLALLAPQPSHAQTHTRTHKRTHRHTHTHTHAHTHTRAHAHTRTRAHAHTRTRSHAHTRTRTHAHTHTAPGPPRAVQAVGIPTEAHRHEPRRRRL